MSLQPTSIPANFSTMATCRDQNVTECHQVETAKWILTVVPVYILLIAVLGVVFNAFVLMVFCLHKKACTVPEIYLSNLAAADLVLMSCLPFWAVDVYNNFNWPFGRFLCKVVNMGLEMNIYCSIYFLVLVSIDRYVALVHPLSHGRLRSPKYAKLGCVLVWGLGFLLGIPTIIYREVIHECNATYCYLNYNRNSNTNYLLFQGMQTVFSFIIPIFIISFCTVKIIQALNKRLMEGLDRQNTEHKATTLVLAVLLVFLICWVPFHLVMIVEMLMRAEVLCGDFSVLTTCILIFVYFAHFNSVLNPILYIVIIGKNFQKKAREAFRHLSGGETSVSMAPTCSNPLRTVKCEKISS